MYHLSIGTSTNRIDLLDEHGICVHDWEPVAGDIQITRSSSALADYSKPIAYREVTTEETFPFNIGKASQDGVAVGLQDLRRMCRAAIDYWVEGWNSDPVYLAAQSSCETNRRYAIVHSAGVPRDDDPYGQPFVGSNRSVMVIDALGVERGPWTETAPGTATCIEACAPENYYCWPSYLEFGVSGDNVDCGSGVALDDLPTSPDGMMVEGWVKADSWGLGLAGTRGHIVGKYNTGEGWALYIDSAHGLCARVEQATTDAISYSGTDEFTPDGLWHHVAMRFSYNVAGDVIKLYIDGAEVTSYALQQSGTGAYVTDAALDLVIGDRHGAPGETWDGDIGWVHVHDKYLAILYEPRCYIPELDPYSVGLWILEGTGATTYNRVTPGTDDGTITGADWACDCVKAYGRMCGDLDQCYPAYLHFDGVSEWVFGDDYSLIQDLPDDTLDMVAEAWVKADGWGANNAGHILSKENHPTYTSGWNFIIASGTGLYGYVNGAGGAAFDGYAGSGIDEFTPDSQWHHVVMAVDSGVGNVADIYLAIDGVWVTSYSTRQQKTGAYGTDVGDNIYIGNRGDGGYTWDGDIGWVRISDYLRYTPGVNFTPPPRCTLPTWDTSTQALWIHEGYGAMTWNLSGGNPGVLSNAAMWECDCDYEVEQSTSCVTQPYVANMLKAAGLTHIYFHDLSITDWSVNLLQSPLPHPLLPPIPAVGDAIYFGVDTTLVNTGPFNNIVFDLMTAQDDLTGQWEFYDTVGAGWQALGAGGCGLPPQDNTNADGLMTGETFDTLGIKSVHWIQDLTCLATQWGPEDLVVASGDATAPAVTGYWIRWVITAIGANPAAPWQQNRSIYTISWPYVEIQATDVPGDIAASMAVELFNESDHDAGTTEPMLRTSRLICGLRSLERGEDFVGYLNASDVQNPPFITFTKDAGWAWNDYFDAPTGRAPFLSIPASTVSTAGQFTIADGYTWQYYGAYRAYIRAYSAGVAGDISLRFYTTFGYSRGSFAYTDWADSEHPGVTELYDLGRVVIPPTSQIRLDEDTEIGFVIEARNNDAGAAHVVRIYDLILIPIDEWAGDYTAMPDTFNGDYLSGNRSAAERAWGGFGSYLYVDSITYPKHELRAASLMRDTANFTGLVDTVANRSPILRQNKSQRLWFVAIQHTSGSEKIANIEICHSVQVYRQANYLSMRGNR